MVVASLLLAGCASTSEKTINYSYQPQGIQVSVTAPSNLNVYQQQAHALTVGVIQAEQIDPFYSFLKSPEGLTNLLLNTENKWMLNRLFIQPGEQQTIGLDRNAKTAYLVLVTGFAQLLPAQSAQIVKIPVEKHSSGFLWLHKDYSAGTLYVYLDLGPQGIVKVRACDEALKPNKTCSQNLLEKIT